MVKINGHSDPWNLSLVGDVVTVDGNCTMETIVGVWAVVENVRVASGAAELAIFTAILYWFFTSRFVFLISYIDYNVVSFIILKSFLLIYVFF